MIDDEQPGVYESAGRKCSASDVLAESALDLRWSFSHAADTIWQPLDPMPRNLIPKSLVSSFSQSQGWYQTGSGHC